MELLSVHEVLGQRVEMKVMIDGIGGPREEALSRIQMVMNRETQRMAEIAGVDVRDQDVERKEAERLRTVPKDRSHVIVGAGSKHPDSVAVIRGTVDVGGRKMSAPKDRS